MRVQVEETIEVIRPALQADGGDIVLQGVDESTLGDAIRKAANAAGVEVQADKEPDRNLFIRSDQYSFVKEGIPALAFKFGYIPGGEIGRAHV